MVFSQLGASHLVGYLSSYPMHAHGIIKYHEGKFMFKTTEVTQVEIL